MTSKKNNKILFIDFDGVLCDSAKEMARTAWLAGSAIWDDLKNRDIPASCLKKFIKLRPLINIGSESIALVKLIDEGYSEGFIKKEFHFLSEQIFTSASVNKKTLVNLFAKVRDDWSTINSKTWAGCHAFYNCAKQILEASAKFYKNCFIVTTKQKRFIEKLFLTFNIKFDFEKIYGLESGSKKKEIIAAILKKEKTKPDNAVIIEDRFSTLETFALDKQFGKSTLLLADWGYVFPEDVERARVEYSQIQVVEQNSVFSILKKSAS